MTESQYPIPLSKRISRWIFGDGERAAEHAAKRALAASLEIESLREAEARSRALQLLEEARLSARRIARQTPAPMPRQVSIPDLDH